MTRTPLTDSDARRALAIVAALVVAFAALVAPAVALVLGCAALGALAFGRSSAKGVR